MPRSEWARYGSAVLRVGLAAAVTLVAAASTGVIASTSHRPTEQRTGGEPGRSGPHTHAADEGGALAPGRDWRDDALTSAPIAVEAEPAVVDPEAPPRWALPPGWAAPALPPPRSDPADAMRPQAPAALEEWRVDDGASALRINLAPGPSHGFANRFDPTDSYDTSAVPPRAVRLRRIRFLVSDRDEPTGPMEWHIWEDNGGHKADVDRDIVAPFTVTGGPGENVIDLVALGIAVTIDPPRQFHVGVAAKASEAGSPDVLLDDGLPFVGSSGDFHASVSGTAIGANAASMHCGVEEWVLLSAQLSGESEARSPTWMVWLEVEWLDPPASLLFETLASPGAPAGEFESASRVAWGDYDGDSLEDILASGSYLYRNQGDGTFANVTASAGITDTGSGAVWADYDNDGDLDFYQYTSNCVPCDKPQADNFDDLWRNNGDGTFTNVRAADYGGEENAPVPRDPLPTEAAAWGDFNGDGYLDLYAANHVDWDHTPNRCFPDYLWLNEGPPAFGFRDVSVDAGIRAVTLCGRGVSPADFDADGDTDIFVSNYRLTADLLWVNTGVDASGVPRFVNEARQRGVEGVAKSGPFAGAYGHTIGAAWGDLDRDGAQDLVAANLAHSHWRCFSDATMVYRSGGWADGYRFTDLREASGVAYVETHSDPSLVDVDNDGYLDLHLTHVYDGWRASLYRNATADAVPEAPPRVFLPAALRRAAVLAPAAAAPGDGNGPSIARSSGLAAGGADGPAVRFQDVTHVSGIYPRTGWGSGWADFDNDGDMDLAARGLWRNTTVERDTGGWLQVRAVGCGPSNRDAVGARIGVRLVSADGSERDVWSEVVSARGTGSQDSRVAQFGLGADGTAGLVRVLFPSGQERRVDVGGSGRRVTVVEVGAVIRPSAWRVPFGEAVDLAADTCGEERVLRWDLDADGAFDDAEGPAVTWRPDEPGTLPVAVEASDGAVKATTRVTIEVLAPPSP